jgi:hypothetical protein
VCVYTRTHACTHSRTHSRIHVIASVSRLAQLWLVHPKGPMAFGHLEVSVHCACVCVWAEVPTRPLGNGLGTSVSVLPST